MESDIIVTRGGICGDCRGEPRDTIRPSDSGIENLLQRAAPIEVQIDSSILQSVIALDIRDCGIRDQSLARDYD